MTFVMVNLKLKSKKQINFLMIFLTLSKITHR